MNRSLFLSLLFSSAAILAQAQYNSPMSEHNHSSSPSQASCPWLPLGSAAKALGGDVYLTVRLLVNGDGSCKFLRRQDSHDSLTVLVGDAAALSSCSEAHTTLRGIGNDAARCKLPSSHGKTIEMVSSRVRDMHFTVTLAASGRKSSTKSSHEQEDVLEQVAEQIAGNLY